MDEEKPAKILIICSNCGSESVNNFCADCGQEVFKNRYSVKKLFLEWMNAFYNYSGGIYYTIYQLTKEPGKVIKEYVSGKTKLYWNPFNFFVITFSVYMLLGIKLGIVGAGSEYETFTNDYTAYIVILTIPFISFFSYVLFKRSGYNYAENLVLNIFIAAQLNIYEIILFLLYAFLNSKTAGVITLFAGLIYEFWVYKSFFKQRIIYTFLKLLIINSVKIFIYIIILAISYILVNR